MSEFDGKERSRAYRPSGIRGARAATRVLSVCLMGLWLVCAAGCPSKASQDANSPSGRRTEDKEQKREDKGHPSASPTTEGSNHQPATTNQQPPTVTQYRYKVIKTYPHDVQAFTQGLEYEDGVLYEGTGLYGQSALIKRNLETGEMLKRERLPRQYFGEGITIFHDRIFQLTWQSKVGFVYDKSTFRLLKEFKYTGEGWGLTHDDKQLIMSDGTAALRFLDPNTLAGTRRVTVRDSGREVTQLNELEYVAPPPSGVVDSDAQPRAAGPQIFANIWGTDSIVVIDPASGQVTGWLDLTHLWPISDRPSPEFVLNGIAYLPKSGHLLITGKCWPKLYEIELTEKMP
jgi:glutamine cyclotransferase